MKTYFTFQQDDFRYICYTANIGKYDDLPTIKNRQQNIRYICFTDTPKLFLSPGPWELVKIGPYFCDNKLTNGYLKALSHIFFGFNVISLWIDANLRDVDTAEAFSHEEVVSVLPHIVRDTVKDEISTVVDSKLENNDAAARHYDFLQSHGFPDNIGLSATMLLVRDHRNPKVRMANEIWWDIISTGVRRDQLSFDFAMWSAGIHPVHLDFDWRVPNRLFSRVKHRKPSKRDLSQTDLEQFRFEPKLNMPELPYTYPPHICYIKERVTFQEINTHHCLNRIVALQAPDKQVEGNYFHFSCATLHEFTPPVPRRSWKREYLRSSTRGSSALVIGLNAGHSAAITLCSQPDIAIHSINIAHHAYTEPCAKYMKEHFSWRFMFTLGDSRSLLPSLNLTNYDFIHINGGLSIEIVRLALLLFCNGALPGTLLMMDGPYIPHIAKMLTEAQKERYIEMVSPCFPCSGENVLFSKL
jgi:hypothetical protein